MSFPTSGPHTLKATYVSSGNLGAASLPAASYTPLGTGQTISCPGTSGTCLIQADEWAQVGESSNAGNGIALCLYVDGSLVDSTCFYSGVIPTGFNWTQASTSIAVAAIPVGTHHVQTKIYTDFGAKGGYYNVNYKVFRP